MANIKITELDAATTLASTDVLVAVDVSEDVTKKTTVTDLFRTLPDGTAAAPALAFSSDAANGVYLAGTDTVGISTGGTQRVTVDGSGNVTISGGLTVEGQTTTVESTIVTIDDKNIELGSVASPSNTTADGGGITLKGATDKTIKWINSTGYWTFNTGIEVGGHLQIDDSNEIRVGTSQDLKIYHDGTNSAIQNATGNFYLYNGGNNIYIRPVNNEDGIVVKANAEVELFYNNVRKLETKSDGIDVTGEVQCDFLDVDGGVDINGGQVFYDATNNLLRWADGTRATFGASNDLQIKHDGANSFFSNYTGGLFIDQYLDDGDILIRTDDGSGSITKYILCDGGEGAVKLYHYGSEKFKTKSDGIDVTGEVQCDSLDVDGSADITGSVTLHGNLDLQDNDKILVGANDDLHIYHNSVASYIDNTTAFGLAIRQLSDDADIVLQSDSGSGGVSTYVRCDGSNGEVQLSHYGSQKFRTKSDGIDVTGEVHCDSLDVDGAGDISGSLQIGSTSSANSSAIVRSSTSGDGGYYFNDGSNAGAIIYNHASNYMKFRVNGSDKGQFDSSGRLLLGTTTEGEVSADNLTIADGGHCGITVRSGTSSEGNIFFSDGTSGTSEYRGAVRYYHDIDELELMTAASGRLRIDSSGSIATGSPGNILENQLASGKYLAVVDTVNGAQLVVRGQSPKLFFDTTSGGSGQIYTDGNGLEFFSGTPANAGSQFMTLDSSNRLMLGTTTPGVGDADEFTVAGSGNIGITIRSGTTSSGNIFFSDATSGTAEYDGYIQYRHNDRALRFATQATERFRITSTGAWAIEGASNYGTSGQVLTSNGNDAPTWQDAGSINVGGASAISMNDNVKINFGNSSDLQIYHDGSNSYIDDAGTGNLKLNGNEVHILSNDNSEYCARFISNGAVRLFHDNSKKFETKSDGVDIIGELQCDTLDVDGNADIAGQLDVNRIVLRDNGATSPLLALRADDSSPWAMIIGNDSYSTNTNHGLAFYQGNDGLVVQQVKGDGAWENFYLQQSNGSTTNTAINIDGNRAVNLRYQGNAKLSTKSDGIDVTGEVQCDSLDVDGTADLTGEVRSHDRFRAHDTNGGIYMGDTTGGFGDACAMARAEVAGYHASGTAVGDLVIGPDRQKSIVFGTTTSSSGGLGGRCRVTSAGHFEPMHNNARDLGSSSLRWRNVYTNDLNLSNEGSANDVDGTWGNYTIQEGEDDLFLINRRNGKKYKFNLTEVS